MAHIALTRPHTASPETLREAVQRLAVDADLYGLFSVWKAPDRLLLTGKGVEAWVELMPAELAVRVTLPWLFRLVRSVIEAEVADRMRAIVAEAEAASATAPLEAR
jgi:Putative polyhydroxyalkanoic acid system protein (PHA_gran_rgn)